VDVFAQQLVNALSLGGVYALLALGLAIVYSILNLINFAHGELMTICGYALFYTLSADLPFAVGLAIGITSAAIAALLMERIAFRPLRGRSGTTLLLSSFAISITLQILFQNLISARPKPVPIPDWLAGSVDVFGVHIGAIQLVAAITSVVVVIALNAFLRHTLHGLTVRAAAEDFSVTRLMGINANRVVATAFGISGLLAGIVGVLWVAQRGSVDPAMGLLPVIKAFIAATIGGLGSLSGAVAGGFLLGAIEVLLQAYLPTSLIPYRDALALLIVVCVVVVRPQGLLGRPAIERA
jgi:branched-chain amino acid transport system permease protein